MSLPSIIAFSGKAGAGKTTAAMMLVATGAGYCRLSFADPLRDMLRALGLTTDDLSERKEVPHLLLGGKTPRQALQTLGTEWGRKMITDDLWLGIARHRLNRALDAGERVCFDDCRFANEAALVRALGGIVINVTRPGQPQLAPAHASEAGLPPSSIDHTLTASDMPGLQVQLHTLLNQLDSAGQSPSL